MAEILKTYNVQFTDASTAALDNDFIVAGTSGSILTQNLVVQSHSAASNTLTLKVWFAGSVVFTKDYILPAGESMFLVELINIALSGGTTPDKITIAISTSLGTGETIDCIASAVEFV